MRVYEVRPRKDNRAVDLISDVLPFGRLWYAEPDGTLGTLGAVAFAMLAGSIILGKRKRDR